MSGSLSYSRGGSHIGYVTPPFPSLSFDLSMDPYTSSLLFHSWDIYVFTVYWHLIFSVGFHVSTIAVAYAVRSRKLRRRHLQRLIWIVLIYAALGAFYGFAVGSFVGLLLASIYKAGALEMSTWVPFTWGLAVMIFTIIVSYESSAVVL